MFIVRISALSQGCLPEGIFFTNQVDIDNFQSNYPDCAEILGIVNIEGPDITKLEGLNSITAFHNKLIIKNTSLTNFSGLEKTIAIDVGCEIIDNDDLTSFFGLDNLLSINGYLTIGFNDNLVSLNGLGSLNQIQGSLWIAVNDNLANLSGLNNLAYTGGGISIVNNPIVNLAGFNKIGFIGGNLHLHGNNNLTSLTGLENISTVVGNLEITGNDSLTNIMSLNMLTSVGQYIKIRNNNLLTSLSGLDNINMEALGILRIYNNSNLSVCHIESVCNYLTNENGFVEIYGNNNGCNSSDEIESACLTGVDGNPIDPAFSIYPNPATKKISIKVKDGMEIKEVNIYNQLGHIKFHSTVRKSTFDISGLGQGVYILKVDYRNGNGSLLHFREKLMVQ